MKHLLSIFAVLAFSGHVVAQDFSSEAITDNIEDWHEEDSKADYARYRTDQYLEIADNVVAYQNDDGGWPKNLDMLRIGDADSLKLTLKPRHRLSTLDNNTTYTHVEFLAGIYTATRNVRYRDAALQGMEYMLAQQNASGGWRGWDADAITYNDGVTCGVMSQWLELIYQKAPYEWVDENLRARVMESWNRGLDVILKTQYRQNGTLTVWAQQHDHQTLQPVKARAYEFPALTASESVGIVMLLMRIRKPSAEVVEAVKAAVAWLDKVKIEGKRIKTINVPEGLEEDRSIKKDRIIVDDPEAKPIWARYYDLEDNHIFFSNRAGEKVLTLAEVPAERRLGYAWYGDWGNKVLDKYPQWLKKHEGK